ncbi:hypothetical protein B0H13DRAFT_2127490, partial [Mycena leptocephala]
AGWYRYVAFLILYCLHVLRTETTGNMINEIKTPYDLDASTSNLHCPGPLQLCTRRSSVHGRRIYQYIMCPES